MTTETPEQTDLETCAEAYENAWTELTMEREFRETLYLAVKATLAHPSIKGRIRRRLELALYEGERLP